MIETLTVLAPDLQGGDELLSTGIGGHAGRITSTRAYEDLVRVDFDDGRSASLAVFEVCSVERVRLAPCAELRAQAG